MAMLAHNGAREPEPVFDGECRRPQRWVDAGPPQQRQRLRRRDLQSQGQGVAELLSRRAEASANDPEEPLALLRGHEGPWADIEAQDRRSDLWRRVEGGGRHVEQAARLGIDLDG